MAKRLRKENIVAQVCGSILMSIVLSVAMPLIARGTVDMYSFVSGFILSFFASLALKLFTPIIEAAQHLTAKLGVKPGTIGYRLVSAIFMAIIMGTIMSLLMTWWQIRGTQGYMALLLKSWLRQYPWVLMIVYLMIVISIPAGNWVVQQLFNRDTDKTHRAASIKDNLVSSEVEKR